MALYRLDFKDDGSPVKDVWWLRPCSCDAIMGGSDFLSRHMTTARGRALVVAQDTGRAVIISRIAKAGQVKPALVILPDGTAKRPDGMAGEDCKAGPGRPPCFCRNCRAERRRT